MAASEKFEIRLPVFEGPFDLLLFFIKRDELDIRDIPIARITHDFLDYIHQLEALDMEVASEFILMAATLIRIKAKILLPSVQKENGESEEVDPREELVRQLLEYKRYKDAAEFFEAMESNMLQRHKRDGASAEAAQIAEEILGVEADLQDVDLYRLLMVYQRVLKRQAGRIPPPEHKITPYPYSVEQQKQYLLNWLDREDSISFERIIADGKNRILLIFNFLAILELVQLQKIRIHIMEGYNNFIIKPLNQEVLLASEN